MDVKLKYALVDTRFGWVMLEGSETGLTSVRLPQSSPTGALAKAGDSVRDAVEEPAVFDDLPKRLKRYFCGEAVEFSDRLDYGKASAFQRAVWDAARSIPHGETGSYSWVAAQMGRPRACRAVGRALGQNPFSIIVPCHRVVGSGGGLCGFGGGLALKKRLLDLESGPASRASSRAHR